MKTIPGLLLLLPLLGITCAPLRGATESVELGALRKAALTDIAERAAAVDKEWLAAMETLEKQRAAGGDYEGAMRVRAALAEWRAAAAGPSASPAAGTGTLPLTPAAALPGGGAEFTDARKTSLRLKRPGATAAWNLTSPPAGVYEVRVTFGAQGDSTAAASAETDKGSPESWRAAADAWKPRAAGSTQAGGVVEFRRVTSFQSDQPPLARVIRPTGGWGNPVTLSMGSVELDGRTVQLSLKALQAEAAGLMDLQGVELVPANLAGVAVGDPADAKEFLRLQEIFERQAAEKTKTLTQKYVAALLEMENRFSRDKDTAGLTEARQERRRLDQGGAASEADGILLPVADPLNMALRGDARLSNQRDFLTRLRPAGTCEIRWKLPGLGIAPGEYTVTLDVRLTPGAGEGGTASLFSASAAAGTGPELSVGVEGIESDPTSTTATATPGTARQKTMVRRTLRPGKLTILKGSEELVLRVLTLARADGSLFDLESVRLIPAGVSPP